ncbi:MAG: NAD-dependent epimerase/dehydratase family protein, partial [Ilumatobacteraceae bacterium]
MRVFVAGGTGAVGRRLVPLLVRSGHIVTGVSRTDAGVRRLRSYGSDARVVDIADRSAVIEAVSSFRPDVIAHQVTDLRHLDLDANATIRRLGTRNLVDAAHTAGVRRIVAQSISWAYEPGETPAVETDRLDLGASEPRLTTVRGIADSEAFVAEVPEFVILRYGMFYGPGTFFATGGRMTDEAHAGQLVGDESITNFIHVDDAAGAALAALDWAPGAVNIGDDEPATAHEWTAVFADAVGAAAPSSRVGRAGGARGAANTHARQDVGWM